MMPQRQEESIPSLQPPSGATGSTWFGTTVRPLAA